MNLMEGATILATVALIGMILFGVVFGLYINQLSTGSRFLIRQEVGMVGKQLNAYSDTVEKLGQQVDNLVERIGKLETTGVKLTNEVEDLRKTFGELKELQEEMKKRQQRAQQHSHLA